MLNDNAMLQILLHIIVLQDKCTLNIDIFFAIYQFFINMCHWNWTVNIIGIMILGWNEGVFPIELIIMYRLDYAGIVAVHYSSNN